MSYITVSDGDAPKRRCRIEFGEAYSQLQEGVIAVIRVYTVYDPELVAAFKRLRWRWAQYRFVKPKKCWEFARVALDKVVGILLDHNFDVDTAMIEREKVKPVHEPRTVPFARYELDASNLKLVEEAARPGSDRWSERVLREQHNFAVLHKSNPDIHLEFNVDNSREVACAIRLKDGQVLHFVIALPMKYPKKPPVTKLDGAFKDTNFKNRFELGYYKRIVGACLGILEKKWKPTMTVAHFAKLFSVYLAAAQYSEAIEDEPEEKKNRFLMLDRAIRLGNRLVMEPVVGDAPTIAVPNLVRCIDCAYYARDDPHSDSVFDGWCDRRQDSVLSEDFGRVCSLFNVERGEEV
jgi:ubiquitin-protein ligase